MVPGSLSNSIYIGKFSLSFNSSALTQAYQAASVSGHLYLLSYLSLEHLSLGKLYSLHPHFQGEFPINLCSLTCLIFLHCIHHHLMYHTTIFYSVSLHCKVKFYESKDFALYSGVSLVPRTMPGLKSAFRKYYWMNLVNEWMTWKNIFIY